MVDSKGGRRTMRVLDCTPALTTSHPFALSSLRPACTRGPILLYYLLLVTRLSYTAWVGPGGRRGIYGSRDPALPTALSLAQSKMIW